MFSKQKIIDDLTKKNSDLESKLTSLEESHLQEIENLNNNIATDEQNHDDAIINLNDSHQNAMKALETEKDTTIERLNEELEEAKKEIERKDNQLNQKELKKLAKAYEDQESEYNKDVSFWKKCLFYVGVLLLATFFFSIVFSADKVWYEKFEYYVGDIILLSALWFCASQFSDAVKLRNDYANRKTLAQSFSNILNSMPEDEQIKNKFIERTTDVLCAPGIVSNKEPVLSKEALKHTIELGKLISGR